MSLGRFQFERNLIKERTLAGLEAALLEQEGVKVEGQKSLLMNKKS